MAMAPARGGRFLLALLVLAALLLGGCANVQVYDASSNSVAIPTVEPVKEDAGLRILAIEFDPPLSSLTWPLVSSHLTLLVAVENSGMQAERDATIRVELWQKMSDGEPVLTRTSSLPIITPGEVRVVSFSGMGDLEPNPTYWLKVCAVPSGESGASAESQKVYRIRLGQEP